MKSHSSPKNIAYIDYVCVVCNVMRTNMNRCSIFKYDFSTFDFCSFIFLASIPMHQQSFPLKPVDVVDLIAWQWNIYVSVIRER